MTKLTPEEQFAQDLAEASQKSLQDQEVVRQARSSTQRLYGIEIENVPGDGNCFYYAMANSLKSTGLTHTDLRQIAVKYIADNPEQYTDPQLQSASCQRPQGQLNSLAQYLSAHSQDKEYADQVILSALSRALKINIIVLSPDSGQPIIHKQANDSTTVFLYYHQNHYQLAKPKPEEPNFQRLLATFYHHPIDEIQHQNHAPGANQHSADSALSSEQLKILAHEEIIQALANPDIREQKEHILDALNLLHDQQQHKPAIEKIYTAFYQQINQISGLDQIHQAVNHLITRTQNYQATTVSDPTTTPSTRNSAPKPAKELFKRLTGYAK